MTATDTPSIFRNTYTNCSWSTLPQDQFAEYMVIPMLCDPAHAWYVKIPIFAARTALYITTRITELVAHTLGGFGQLTEHAHTYVQRELFGASYVSAHTLHSTVIDVAEGSLQANEAFVFHAVEHLHKKMCADYEKLQDVFSRNIAASEKITALAHTFVEWTFLLTEVTLTQLSSTAAFFAESALEVEALIKPDMDSLAYKAARADLAKYGVTADPSSWFRGSRGTNPFHIGPTSLSALPSFNAGELLSNVAVDYDTIKGDAAQYRAWLVGACDFLASHQDQIQPVKLKWHHNLCYYDTFMQTILHTMLMDGTFKDERIINGLFAYDDSPFTGELSAFRADIIRYTLGLVQGVSSGKSASITLDGNLPIEGPQKADGRYSSFGRAGDVQDVTTLFTHATALGFAPKEANSQDLVERAPLSIGIHPTQEGDYETTWTSLSISEWFDTDRKMLFVQSEVCRRHLKTWLEDLVPSADVVIAYRNTRYSVRHDGPRAEKLMEAIAQARQSGTYAEIHFTFTVTDLPEIDPLLDVHGHEARHFHSLGHPLLEGADFEPSVAEALSRAYTNSDATIWHIAGEDCITDKVNASRSLDDLKPLFMHKVIPTTQTCVTDRAWTLMHGHSALFRLRVSDQDAFGRITMRPAANMVKPERSFVLKGKRFDLRAFTRHTGGIGGGHWIAYRFDPISQQFYELNDTGSNKPITDEKVEEYLKGSGAAYQINEAIYEVSEWTDADEEAARLANML